MLIALGLVVATMRQLNKPQTAERLGQLFGEPQRVEQPTSEHQFVLAPDVTPPEPQQAPESAPAATSAPAISTAGQTAEALSRVRDNTYFRPAESDAWFGLFDRLQQTDAEQLRAASVGEVSYAQLLKQPEVYRGQVVTLRGTVRQQEVERPAENKLDLETYHRLVLQPRGGGNWPFIVYCLHLPDNFPRGEHLSEPVSVSGFFFKNWSYAWQEGLGIAPTVLARHVDWQPAAAVPQRQTIKSVGLIPVLIVALLSAVLVVWLVLRNTRRPPALSRSSTRIVFPDDSAAETVQQRLQRLAKAETEQ